MKDIKKAFIDNIIYLMKEKRISQANLATALSVDQTTVSAWLRGESEPTLSKICLLMDYFGVSFEDMID